MASNSFNRHYPDDERQREELLMAGLIREYSYLYALIIPDSLHGIFFSLYHIHDKWKTDGYEIEWMKKNLDEPMPKRPFAVRVRWHYLYGQENDLKSNRKLIYKTFSFGKWKIPGLRAMSVVNEVIKQMRVWSRVKIKLSPDCAYGEEGCDDLSIKPNSCMIIHVEVLRIIEYRPGWGKRRQIRSQK